MRVKRIGVVLALSAFATAASAAGPTFSVNTVADAPDALINGVCETAPGNGLCSLRAAIMEANFYGGPDDATIRVPAGTFLLTIPIGVPDDQRNGDLELYGHVKIQGSGADLTIIDGNLLDRVFYLGPDAFAILSDLRIQGGRPPASYTRHCDGHGAGVCADGGHLTLVRCIVRANEVPANAYGGGIAVFTGALAVYQSAIRINSAPGSSGRGGGVSVLDTSAYFERSTINANSAAYGGGIEQTGGWLYVVNSTVSQNVASQGGGIYVSTAQESSLSNVTNVGNTASSSGVDMFVAVSDVHLLNSIVRSMTCGELGDLHPDGFSILTDVSSCFIFGAYFAETPGVATFGLFGANGGTTATYALAPGSPAVNAGDPAGCTDVYGYAITTDQRGVTRPIGARCDIGAFELEPIGDANGDGAVNVSDVFYLINYLFAGGVVPLGRANVNGDSAINVSDVFYLVNYLFAGGAEPI